MHAIARENERIDYNNSNYFTCYKKETKSKDCSREKIVSRPYIRIYIYNVTQFRFARDTSSREIRIRRYNQPRWVIREILTMPCTIGQHGGCQAWKLTRVIIRA